MSKKILAFVLASLMLLSLCLTACGDDGSGAGKLEAIKKEDLKIGFMYVGDAYDGGYSQAHEEAPHKCGGQGVHAVNNNLSHER